MELIYARLLETVKEKDWECEGGNSWIPLNILSISGGLINSEPLPPLPSPHQFSCGQKATYPPVT